MKSYQEMMLEKYADELEDALSNDLNKACKILTKIFKGATMYDMMHVFDECEIDLALIEDCVYGGRTLLKGTRSFDNDAYGKIYDIMETLHYDNGLPLSGYNYPEDNPTEWNDYFEHYDRDQDFGEFFLDEAIYSFVTDGQYIHIKVDLSFADLRDCLVASYDGADWDHDFNRKW